MSISKEQLGHYTYNSLFIETGTYRGRCVQAALELGFEKIISIEIDPEFYVKACERFKNYPNVKLILGDSVEVLEEVLSLVGQPATIYLDAHGDTCGRGSLNSKQVLSELEVIKKFYKKGSVIIIDDFADMFSSNESQLNLTNKLLEIDSSLKIHRVDGAKFKKNNQKEVERIRRKDILIVEENLVMENPKVYISFGAIMEQEVHFLLEKFPDDLLIIAYDPLDACFEKYLLIDHPHFRAYKYAVSDFTGEAVLQVGITGIQSTMVPYSVEKAFRKDGSPEYSEETQKINVVSAESVLLQYPEIDRLDINAEGSEIQILMGTPLSVLARCKMIHVEFHIFAKWFEMTQEQVDKCVKRLSSHFNLVINDSYHPCYSFLRKEL